MPPRGLGLPGPAAGNDVGARLPFNSRVITVDPEDVAADHGTIQAAIDAASSGDTIIIGSGTYTEQLTLKDGITLVGLGGSDAVTVVTTHSANGSTVTKPSTDTGVTYCYGITFRASVVVTSPITVSAVSIEGGFVRMWDCEILLFRNAASGGGTYRALNVLNAAAGGGGFFHRCYIHTTDVTGDTTQTTYAVDWAGKVGYFHGGRIEDGSIATTRAAINWNPTTASVQCILREAPDITGEIINNGSGSNIVFRSIGRVSGGISGTASPLYDWQVFHKEDYDAVVAAEGGDYTSIKAAFDAGHATVFVKNGTYLETGDIVIPENGALVGESFGGVVIDFNGGAFSVIMDGSGGTKETAGTISISNGATLVTGSGTTFTNLSGGDYILLEDAFHEIASITDNTNLQLVTAYQGATISSLAYQAHSMFVGSVARNIRVEGSLTNGWELLGCLRATIQNCSVFGSTLNGFDLGDCGEISLVNCYARNNAGDGLDASTCAGVHIIDGSYTNNSARGIDGFSSTAVAVSSGCVADQNGTAGIRLGVLGSAIGAQCRQNNGIGIEADDKCRIDGCEVSENNGVGISLDSDTFCTITGNRIFSNGSHGVDASATSADHTIAGNLIRNNAGTGVIVGGIESIVSSNRLQNNTSHGIHVTSAATDITIVGNVIIDGGARGILIDGDRVVVTGNTVRLNTTTDVDVAATADGTRFGTNEIGVLADAGTNSIYGLEITLPLPSTDNALPRFDGTGGRTLQSSGITVSDNDEVRHAGTVEWDKGADIASAATLTLGTDGNYFDVTGVTGITAVSAKPIGTRILLHFDGILTVTHHATNLILRDGSNFTTAAGNHLELICYDGTNWREIGRSTANAGTTDADAIHDNVAGEIALITEKGTGVGADLAVIEDSADSNNKKRLQLSNLPYPVTLAGAETLTNKTLNSFTNDIYADHLHEEIRNESGGAMTRGDAVYISGFSVGQSLPLCQLANAGAAGTMPAVAILASATLANNANGNFVEAGIIENVDTSAWSAGDELYVSTTGTTTNTLTNVKPTGTALIQKVAIVLRSHATLGVIEVIGAGRANDLPNLPQDNVWLGNGSGVPTETSRVGIDTGAIQGPASATDNALPRFDGATGKLAQNSGVTLNDSDQMDSLETATFKPEHDNGSQGASWTLNWNNGQKQRVTLTASTTSLTITAPPGPGNFLLKVIQGGAGSFGITWPASVRWPGGTAPDLTNAAASEDIISFYYDGTNYYGVASLDFS